MKKYLKNFEITEEEIRKSIYECLSRDRWRRRDTSYMFAEYYMKMRGIDCNKHDLAAKLRNIAYSDEKELYPLVNYISHCIYAEIKTRTISLPPINYQKRKDNSNGKIREIGISSMKQQLYDYVVVNICKDMFMAKIGTYQCASIKGRGQIYGKNAIEKWFHKNPKKCRYIAKCDVRKYYPSVDKGILKDLLNRDVANDDVLYVLFTLIDTYKSGLCIGSYLSQFLANYILSYAYHYLDEYCFKYRRGKRKNLVWKKLFYMDDIFMCGSRKSDVKSALRMLEKYFSEKMHLSLKEDWKLYCIDDFPTDMMGFKIEQSSTTVRKRIFERADKLFMKYKDTDIPMTEKDARAIISYYGYFKHSNSKAYMNKMKVARTLERAKGVIRDVDRNNKQNA